MYQIFTYSLYYEYLWKEKMNLHFSSSNLSRKQVISLLPTFQYCYTVEETSNDFKLFVSLLLIINPIEDALIKYALMNKNHIVLFPNFGTL